MPGILACRASLPASGRVIDDARRLASGRDIDDAHRLASGRMSTGRAALASRPGCQRRSPL
jgi:hypothetical protein